MSFLDELNSMSKGGNNLPEGVQELTQEEQEEAARQAEADFAELIERLIEYCKNRCRESAVSGGFCKVTTTEFFRSFEDADTDAVGEAEGWQEWWDRIKYRVGYYLAYEGYFGFTREDRWPVRKAVKEYFEGEGLSVSFGERKWDVMKVWSDADGEVERSEKQGEIYELTFLLVWE